MQELVFHWSMPSLDSRVPRDIIGRTSAFIVPCSACLWFLRNLGSVPLSEGYLCVLGFLILFSAEHVSLFPSLWHANRLFCCFVGKD